MKTQAEQPKHAQGEWKTKGINIINERGERIAICCGVLDTPIIDDEATAKRIVIAVNSFDRIKKLLEQLDNVLTVLHKKDLSPSIITVDEVKGVLYEIRSAENK